MGKPMVPSCSSFALSQSDEEAYVAVRVEEGDMLSVGDWRVLWPAEASMHALLELLAHPWHPHDQYTAAVCIHGRLIAAQATEPHVAAQSLQGFLDAGGAITVSSVLGQVHVDSDAVLRLLEAIVGLPSVQSALAACAAESVALHSTSRNAAAYRLPTRWQLGAPRWQEEDEVVELMARIPEEEIARQDPRANPECVESAPDTWEYVPSFNRWRSLDDGADSCEESGGVLGRLPWGGDPLVPLSLWGRDWQKRNAVVPTDNRMGALLLETGSNVSLQDRQIFRLLEKAAVSCGCPSVSECKDLRLGGLLHLISVVLALPASWDVELATQFREGCGSRQRHMRTRVLARLLAHARTSESAQPLHPDDGGIDALAHVSSVPSDLHAAGRSSPASSLSMSSPMTPQQQKRPLFRSSTAPEGFASSVTHSSLVGVDAGGGYVSSDAETPTLRQAAGGWDESPASSRSDGRSEGGESRASGSSSSSSSRGCGAVRGLNRKTMLSMLEIGDQWRPPVGPRTPESGDDVRKALHDDFLISKVGDESPQFAASAGGASPCPAASLGNGNASSTAPARPGGVDALKGGGGVTSPPPALDLQQGRGTNFSLASSNYLSLKVQAARSGRLDRSSSSFVAPVERMIGTLHRLLRRLILERDECGSISVSVNSLEGTLLAARQGRCHSLPGSTPGRGDQSSEVTGDLQRQDSWCDWASDTDGNDEDGLDDFDLIIEEMTFRNYMEAAAETGRPAENVEIVL